ncbi:MAG: hypothetical protein ABL958_16970 [Bdellovibrionia bacterium]
MIAGYQRVSRKCPCRVCGKPDWCSTTKDQNISFCARCALNADRLSRNGWGIYYNNLLRNFDFAKELSTTQHFYGLETPLAPIERRDKIYRKLIQPSLLSQCHGSSFGSEWISVQIREVGRYGVFPKTTIERHRLVRSLIEAFVKDDGISPTFIGVPGFWRGSNRSPRLGSDFDYDDDLVLIPFFDRDGLIQACQIRAMRGASNKSGKYLWLSSVRKRDGCGPGTPLHYEGAVGFKGNTIETVLVTEGALKAATAQKFLPDRYVVGNSGVATSHNEIVKTARKKILEIAFDADCFTNPHVARSLASLIALRIREQQFLSYDHPTKILTWDRRFKGIDDALIAGASIKNLNVSEWLRSLTPECFEAARHQLEGISL